MTTPAPAWFSVGPARAASWRPPLSNPRTMADIMRKTPSDAAETAAFDHVFVLPAGLEEESQI